MSKIAINGFGRIGRAFFKLVLQQDFDNELSRTDQDRLEIVAINDLGDIENLAYLLKYDSVYGRYDKEVKVEEEAGKKYLVVGRFSTHKASEGGQKNKVLFLNEKDPIKLPWGDLGIDIVVEATGIFESFEKAAVHKQAGAKRVILTAPAKGDDAIDARTVLMGVNEDDLKTCSISSNGSCTTNSVSSVLQILSERLGVKKAFLNTAHGYTATQNLVDGLVRGHDFRRGRAAAANIIPSYTGAAIAVTRAIDELEGKFDGMAMRVPTLTGSLSCITFVSSRLTTVEELNKIFRDAESEDRWKGTFKTISDQIVSSDIIGDPYAAIVDLSLTKVVDDDLCTVFSWYDNEFGYTNTLVQHVLKVASLM